MARLGDGVLMQRAAAGLAATTATALGRVYGARVVVLAGVGRQRRRRAVRRRARWPGAGARVDALLRRPGPGPRRRTRGAPRGRRAGRRRTAQVAARADVVLDGLVGIGGTGGLATRGRRAGRARRRGRARDRGGPAERRRRRHRRGGRRGRPGRPHGDVRDVQARAPGRPGRRRTPAWSCWSTSGSTTSDFERLGRARRGVGAGVAGRRRRGRAAAARRPSRTSTRAACVGVLAGSATYSGRRGARGRRGAARRRRDGARGQRAARGRGVVRHAWPEAVVTELDRRRRPARRRPGAGLGGRARASGPTRSRRRGSTPCSASDVPVLVDADGLTVLAERAALAARPTAPTLLTPHAGELARLLGVDRGDVEARRLALRPPGGRASSARRCCSRARRRVICRAGRRLRHASTPIGTPALATAGIRRRAVGPDRRAARRRPAGRRRGRGRRVPARPGRPPRRRRRPDHRPARSSPPSPPRSSASGNDHVH